MSIDEYSRAFQENRFFTVFKGFIADYPDPENFLDEVNEWHQGGFQSVEMEELLLEAKGETDPSVRIPLFQRADKVLMDSAAIIPVAYGREHYLVKPWVRGLNFTASYDIILKNVVIEPH